ncbi:VanZ family protein [Phaeocystidibacter marisrubri]|uniref:VanZ family protein n=1 Tax=Phaeocystidibacter marisrubri TaxID=1577780 RepID=A0A6L3ZG94_9FLAO|nr:VanZ family protein [Phaeocystidibacter marisrubri]KAB2816931.1 VanZ family protein [Phaeocystidibacter marisrubri]GGH77545.1 hypothetical protein GCM10011318_27480 [Phaeocystidibacter marisrubri]
MNTKTILVDKKSPILYYTPVISWGVFVLVMSLLPSRDLPDALIEVSDLFIHACIYVAWTMLACWGYVQVHQRMKQSAYMVILCCALVFGLGVEFAQKYLTDYRHFEWADILANSTGSIVGLGITFILSRRKK